MRATAACSMVLAVGALSILLISAVTAAPMVDPDDEDQSENSLASGAEEEYGLGAGWSGLDTPPLRRLMLELDAEQRFGRVGRSWPMVRPVFARAEPRARSWRADKRQARFRQCYFNPISCFRK